MFAFSPLNIASRDARETLYEDIALYAHLYLNLQGFQTGAKLRPFMQMEYHRWCSWCDLDVEYHKPLVDWFAGLMHHIGLSVKLHQHYSTNPKASMIEHGLMRDAIPVYHPKIEGFFPEEEAKHLPTDRRKAILLTGDPEGVSSKVTFDHPCYQLKALVATIRIMETYLARGQGVTRHRGESNAEWFRRVEVSIGVKQSKTQRDKGHTRPRKGTR